VRVPSLTTTIRPGKPHKHAGHGDAERKPVAELRRIGKRRRIRRHDLGDALS